MNALSIIEKKPKSRYGYEKSILVRPSTIYRLQKYGRIGVTYEKILVRMMDIIDSDPKLKSAVIDYEGYDSMEIEY
jgi:hypothetical protein